MNRTAKWVAVFSTAALLWVGGCLMVEFRLLSAHEPPFTAWWRTVWANEPWPILLGSVMLAGAVGFLAGHFFAADRKTYDSIRKE